MKVYTEVVWQWDEEKGELVEESSKSYDYEGPTVEAVRGFNILPTLRGFEAGWKRAFEESGHDDLGGQLGWALSGGAIYATGMGLSGAYQAGALGKSRVYGMRTIPEYRGTSKSKSSPTLKTHIAGQANNFGRYGDISQQAPGGWIRQQQKNRYGRASTILTRGTSRKTLVNKKKS